MFFEVLHHPHPFSRPHHHHRPHHRHHQNDDHDQELGLLLVLVAVAILTYSSLVYFAERELPVGPGGDDDDVGVGDDDDVSDDNDDHDGNDGDGFVSGASRSQLHWLGGRYVLWQVFAIPLPLYRFIDPLIH